MMKMTYFFKKTSKYRPDKYVDLSTSTKRFFFWIVIIVEMTKDNHSDGKSLKSEKTFREYFRRGRFLMRNRNVDTKLGLSDQKFFWFRNRGLSWRSARRVYFLSAKAKNWNWGGKGCLWALLIPIYIPNSRGVPHSLTLHM